MAVERYTPRIASDAVTEPEVVAPPSGAARACVTLGGVTKTYEAGRPPAVADLTLEIRQGEFFSLLGPSGSGKTTTLRVIAGFEWPDSGTVELEGVDVSGTPPYRRDVSTVFQSYALFPHMTVERNVAYPLRMRRVDKSEIPSRVGEALELVSMTGYEKRLPHQLSGGQRQRIAVARALVSRPKVVLLDEPLGALDLQLRQTMQLMLKRLQREVDVTFIYVTHDQGEALAMSDRLAVMNEGRIEQLGTPVDVYYRPANRFVASFIGKSNLLAGSIERTAEGPVLHSGELRLALAPDTAAAGEATAAIRYEAVGVRARAALDDTVGHDGWAGTVQEVIFLGDGLELALEVGGASLVAKLASQGAPQFAPGDEVVVNVDAGDVRVLHG